MTTTIGLVLDVAENDPAWQAPLAASPAGLELAAEESNRERPDGSWPWLGALLCARTALRAAAEEAAGFVGLLHDDGTSLAADVLCRAILESASLAWWLLDPAIGAEGRLARWLAFRLHIAWQTKTAVGTLNLEPEADRADYGELPAEVGKAIVDLGPAWTCTSTKSRQSCRNETWPGPAARVADLLQHIWPEPRMPYAVLSAVAHGEVLGLWRNVPHNVPGQRPAPHTSSAIWLWHDVYLITGGLLFTASRGDLPRPGPGPCRSHRMDDRAQPAPASAPAGRAVERPCPALPIPRHMTPQPRLAA